MAAARLKSGSIVYGNLADVFTKIGIATPLSDEELSTIKIEKAKKFGGRPKGATNKPKLKAKSKVNQGKK
jgi:hypothetical protein